MENKLMCSSRSIGTGTRLESIRQRESPPVDVELVGHKSDRLFDLCDQPGKLLSRAVHMVFSGILTAALRHLRSKLRLLNQSAQARGDLRMVHHQGSAVWARDEDLQRRTSGSVSSQRNCHNS